MPVDSEGSPHRCSLRDRRSKYLDTGESFCQQMHIKLIPAEAAVHEYTTYIGVV